MDQVPERANDRTLTSQVPLLQPVLLPLLLELAPFPLSLVIRLVTGMSSIYRATVQSMLCCGPLMMIFSVPLLVRRHGRGRQRAESGVVHPGSVEEGLLVTHAISVKGWYYRQMTVIVGEEVEARHNTITGPGGR